MSTFISKNKHFLNNRRVLLDHLCISAMIFQPQISMRQHIRNYTAEKYVAVVHNRKSKKKTDNLGVNLTLSLLRDHEVYEVSRHIDLFFPSLE